MPQRENVLERDRGGGGASCSAGVDVASLRLDVAGLKTVCEKQGRKGHKSQISSEREKIWLTLTAFEELIFIYGVDKFVNKCRSHFDTFSLFHNSGGK